MDSIRCGCGRRCSVDDAVCLFCGRDPRAAAPARSLARRALTLGGAAIVASAIVAAPVLLAACGCGGCGVPAPTPGADAGTGGDSGPQS